MKYYLTECAVETMCSAIACGSRSVNQPGDYSLSLRLLTFLDQQYKVRFRYAEKVCCW